MIYIIILTVSQGLAVGIVGPTLPDLRERLAGTYEELARAMIGQSVGYFIGSFIGGIIHERFYRYNDVMIIIELFIWSVGEYLSTSTSALRLIPIWQP